MTETLNVPASASTDPQPDPSGADAKPAKGRSLWTDAWQDLRRSPMFVISAVLIVLLLTMVAFPGWFTSASPTVGDLTHHYQGEPRYTHFFGEDWFGYDTQGRSVWARMVHGARASVLVGVLVTLSVTLVGGIVGLVAGYFGGWLDSVLSRITDIFQGIPFLLGAMVVLTTFTKSNLWVVIAALLFLGWTQIARVARGSVITVKQSDYVHAAKSLGASTVRIMFRHIVPNALAPVVVVATTGPRRLHRGRSDTLLPGHRPGRTRGLLGCGRLQRQGRAAYRAAHSDFPRRHGVPHRAGVHHARRCGPQRPRSEEPLREAGEDMTLLEVRDLHVDFQTRDGVVKAVNGVKLQRRGR